MKPHKHAELIKAWADGAEIQLKGRNNEWIDIFPDWQDECEYRIKPESKPDIEEELTVYRNMAWQFGEPPDRWNYPKVYTPIGNLKLIWDGITGELKSAEVLK